MNPFVVVRVFSSRQYRQVAENRDARMLIEYRAQNTNSADENNNLSNPHPVYFCGTEDQASQLADTLAYWNPGSEWHWYRIAGVAKSRRPGDPQDIKKITEKGYLPVKDIA